MRSWAQVTHRENALPVPSKPAPALPAAPAPPAALVAAGASPAVEARAAPPAAAASRVAPLPAAQAAVAGRPSHTSPAASAFEAALGGALLHAASPHLERAEVTTCTAPAPLRPRGLTNSTNVCFANAILQAFMACRPLTRLVRSLPAPPPANGAVSAPWSEALLPCMRFMHEFKTMNEARTVANQPACASSAANSALPHATLPSSADSSSATPLPCTPTPPRRRSRNAKSAAQLPPGMALIPFVAATALHSSRAPDSSARTSASTSLGGATATATSTSATASCPNQPFLPAWFDAALPSDAMFAHLLDRFARHSGASIDDTHDPVNVRCRAPPRKAGSAGSSSAVSGSLSASVGGGEQPTRRQEDAGEFLHYFIDAMHGEMTRLMTLANLADRSASGTSSSSSPSSSASSPSASACASAVTSAAAHAPESQWHEVGRSSKVRAVASEVAIEASPIQRLFAGRMRSVLRKQGSRDTVSYQPFVSIPLDIATTYVASGGRRDHETADRGCESASATADASDPADEWVTIKPSKASAKAAAVAAPAPTHSVAATVDASDPCLSVDDALAAFMCTEPLYGFKNPGSSQEVRASRNLSLEHLPPVLALQLKRFWFDDHGPCKILRDVRFDERLRLPAAYLFGDAAASCSASGGCCEYRLFAVLVHHGARLGEGHYTVFARHTLPASGADGGAFSSSTAPAGRLLDADYATDDDSHSERVNGRADAAIAASSARPAGPACAAASEQWLHFDDERVTRVTLHRVLAERAGAYLLFYERVPV